MTTRPRLRGGLMALALVLTGCASSTPEPVPEGAGIRQLRVEFPELEKLSDVEVEEAARTVCAVLSEASPQDFVSESIAPETNEDARKAWGLVFFAVRVYCPEHTSQLPTERPY